MQIQRTNCSYKVCENLRIAEKIVLELRACHLGLADE